MSIVELTAAEMVFIYFSGHFHKLKLLFLAELCSSQLSRLDNKNQESRSNIQNEPLERITYD